jgi:uncharacterized protein YggT (Ycf19 family)
MQSDQTSTTVTSEVTSQTPTIPTTPGEHPQKTYATKKAIFRAYQVIWYILGVIESLLLARIVLKALGANPNSGFTNLIYTISNPLAVPFRGIFQSGVVEGSVFEWSTLIAGVVYTTVAFGLVQLFQLIKPTNPQEVEQKVNSQ